MRKRVVKKYKNYNNKNRYIDNNKHKNTDGYGNTNNIQYWNADEDYEDIATDSNKYRKNVVYTDKDWYKNEIQNDREKDIDNFLDFKNNRYDKDKDGKKVKDNKLPTLSFQSGYENFNEVKTFSKKSKYYISKVIFNPEGCVEPIEGDLIKVVSNKNAGIDDEELKNIIDIDYSKKPPQISFKSELYDYEIRSLMDALKPREMYYFIPRKTHNSHQNIKEQVIPITKFQMEEMKKGNSCKMNKKTLHIEKIFDSKTEKIIEPNNFRDKITDCIVKQFQYKHPYGWTNSFAPDTRGKEFVYKKDGKTIRSYVFNNFLGNIYKNGKYDVFKPLMQTMKQCKYNAQKNNEIFMFNCPISINNIGHAINMTFSIQPNGRIFCTLTNSNGLNLDTAKARYFLPLKKDLEIAFKNAGITRGVSYYWNETGDQKEFGDCMQQSLTFAERIAKNPVYLEENGIKTQYEVSSKAFQRMFKGKVLYNYYNQFKKLPIEKTQERSNKNKNYENQHKQLNNRNDVINKQRRNFEEEKNNINKIKPEEKFNNNNIGRSNIKDYYQKPVKIEKNH